MNFLVGDFHGSAAQRWGNVDLSFVEEVEAAFSAS